MGWDHRYRMLEQSEVIRESDEVMTDGPGWQPAGITAGQKAPDPAYTAHRWYRRLKEPHHDQ